jgi:hypothetical protein
VRQVVWRQLVTAAGQHGSPRDPVRFVEVVGEHLNDLVVYAEPDSACRCCQSDLEVWCHAPTGERVDVCTLLGCTRTPDGGPWDGDRSTLVPASREQITTWFGGADLVPLP